MLSITKLFRFSASHQLYNHNGKCHRLHGHSYLLEITIEGRRKINDTRAPDYGMIMDFGKLKKIVNDHVIDKLDHSHLNDFVFTPTAENLTFWIANQLYAHIDGLKRVRLWEEMGSACCTWES